MGLTITLLMTVAGCPTTCMHCVRSGHSFPAMPLDNIRVAADAFADYSSRSNVEINPFMMNEFLEHDDPIGVVDILQKRFPNFQLGTVATDGVSLGKREDWEFVISGLQKMGAARIWFAFHGQGTNHDELVQRPGAYQELREAIRRVRAIGVDCGTNVFINTKIAKDFIGFVNDFDRFEFEKQEWTIAFYAPTARLRSYEKYRPGLSCLGSA